LIARIGVILNSKAFMVSGSGQSSLSLLFPPHAAFIYNIRRSLGSELLIRRLGLGCAIDFMAFELLWVLLLS